MAFPHPQSRKNHQRNEDKTSSGRVVWNFVERTVDISEYRNAKDQVNPAKNRTRDGLAHDGSFPLADCATISFVEYGFFPELPVRLKKTQPSHGRAVQGRA
jgi:hypothetical protein